MTDRERTQMREDGFFKGLIPPVLIPNDQLDRSVETNCPVVLPVRVVFDTTRKASQPWLDNWTITLVDVDGTRIDGITRIEFHYDGATERWYGEYDHVVEVVPGKPVTTRDKCRVVAVDHHSSAALESTVYTASNKTRSEISP